MSAKRKFPQKGDMVVVNHENSSETYFFDGESLVDSVGTMFTDKNIDWNETWKTDKTWRFASDEERKAYEEELNKNGLFISKNGFFISNYDAIVSRALNYHYVEKSEKTDYVCTTSFDVYKNEIVRLYELLDDIDFMAQLGKFIDNEALLTMIRIKCNRRKRFIKDKGRDLFFNGEKLTENKTDEDE